MRSFRYIDTANECIRCGAKFIIRVYEDGTYHYLNTPCECDCDFEPMEGEPSISQAVRALELDVQ